MDPGEHVAGLVRVWLVGDTPAPSWHGVTGVYAACANREGIRTPMA